MVSARSSQGLLSFVRRRYENSPWGILTINKRGFELSMSFIVMLLITVIIFAGSIYFLTQFYTSTEEIRNELDRDTEDQLKSLMRDGSLVAVPFNKAKLAIGKGQSFGVGIQNVKGVSEDFGIAVAFSTAFDQNEDPLQGGPNQPDGTFINSNWVVYAEGPHKIDNNDYKLIPIYIKTDREVASGIETVPGTYVFNVCVYGTDYTAGPFQAVSECGYGQNINQWYTKKIYKIFVEVP